MLRANKKQRTLPSTGLKDDAQTNPKDFWAVLTLLEEIKTVHRKKSKNNFQNFLFL